MPKTKKMSGGCGSCGMVGGCGCSLKQTSGGRKKTKKVTKGGSIMGNIIESAKSLSIPFGFILAKQTLQDKMNKPKNHNKHKSRKNKKSKKLAKGGGNILNVMK